MSCRLSCMLVALLALCLRGWARSDEIRLKDGRSLEGEIVRQTAREIILRMGNARIKFKMEEVAEIIRRPLFIHALKEKEEALKPDDAAGREKLALECFARRRFEEGVRLARDALKIDPTRKYLHQALANQLRKRVNRLLENADRLFQEDEFEAALGQLKAIEVLYPEVNAVIEIATMRGRILQQMEMWEQALGAWNAALQQKPRLPTALKGKLTALAALERYADAAVVFRTLAAISAPDQAKVFRQRAEAMLTLAELGTDPEKLKTRDLARLAAARECLGDVRGAYTAAKKAVELSPGDLKLLRLFSVLGMKLGKSHEVLDTLRAVVATHPRFASELHGLILRIRYNGAITLAETRGIDRLQKLVDLVEDYLVERSRERRRKLIRRLEDFNDLPFRVFEAVVSTRHRVPEFPTPHTQGGEHPSGTLEKLQRTSKATVYRTHHKVPGESENAELYLAVPDSYNPGKPVGLLIALHGAGGVGLHSAIVWGKLADEYNLVVACPTAFPKYGFGLATPAQRHLLAVRKWSMDHFNIDPNRVYLTGASNGANAAWAMSVLYADRFAAAATLLGSPLAVDNLVDNLLNLPMHVMNGGKDPVVPLGPVRAALGRLRDLGCEYVFKLKKTQEHRIQFSDIVDSVRWMATRKRNPYPQKVVLVSNRLRHYRSYWLEVAERREGKIRLVAMTNPRTRDVIERVRISNNPVKVIAEINGNTINIRAANVRTLRILVNDRMLDLDEEVRVRVNDMLLFHGKVKRSPAFLLEKARLLDRGMLFANYIDVEMP